MSVRAYKIKTMEWENEPTFNLWQNPNVCDLAVWDSNITENGGMLEFSREDVELRIKELKNSKDDKIKEEVTIYKGIIKDMGEEDYVIYTCF